MAALLVLVLAYLTADPIEHRIYHPIAHLAGLHIIDGGTMMPGPYGALMVFRLAWNVLLVLAICAVLGRRFAAPPLTDPKAAWFIAIGMATGLAVMSAAIGGILAVGGATVTSSTQSLASAIGNGAGWIIFDLVGATGEELFGRLAILLVIERFVGWKGAILASGLMFSVVHFDNPGASAIWLVRLFLQGMMLAYAVYRTRSLWWSVGYHTGWNWASAPLFGAAGSGYRDRGHLFDFTPAGPGWITGGGVGPEGSIFAFVAVVVALGCLIASTQTSEASRHVSFASP
jgi:membrane protease YdiL (CAAX protease family)